MLGVRAIRVASERSERAVLDLGLLGVRAISEYLSALGAYLSALGAYLGALGAYLSSPHALGAYLSLHNYFVRGHSSYKIMFLGIIIND